MEQGSVWIISIKSVTLPSLKHMDCGNYSLSALKSAQESLELQTAHGVKQKQTGYCKNNELKLN